MAERRLVKEEELILANHLLQLAGENASDFDLPTMVDEYEGGKMGSINFTPPEKAAYGGDIVQVVYNDSDEVPVVITLTKNINNEILDMDFWKKDFSKLLQYPTPDKVAIADKNGFI
ncbi:DUF6984 family protein [Flammeovirga kamogawensis]|uniref:DUF6984 domain-containing protein n=1 Tax=Flammeovirga kamogawensis TaxID=373891 RepID=A0ABX8H0B1_9BACT|nr:hypothetical protein [Flammeovirga kamogawensis]MBB6459287.1 hypothetical protein [Flammeovirga kamogawensis]QWG08847.1 hypothetical protein KM029_07870 [Flammeovirga kamogawensis]TRX67137.1 hypothetical protein EO216_02915 [Flammeovirga kamogawensis]